eukprot:scaffold32224_cov58-Attheya_sp.AAC.1
MWCILRRSDIFRQQANSSWTQDIQHEHSIRFTSISCRSTKSKQEHSAASFSRRLSCEDLSSMPMRH